MGIQQLGEVTLFKDILGVKGLSLKELRKWSGKKNLLFGRVVVRSVNRYRGERRRVCEEGNER